MSDGSRSAYWQECVSIALNEVGIIATPAQIERVAGEVESAHENYGMAFHTPSSGAGLRQETENLRAQLTDERRKVHCRECNGSGRVVTRGPIHGGDEECHRCRGEGRHKP